MIFDPLYLIILAPALILAGIAQMKVKSAYHKASRMRAGSGLSGAEAARRILDANNLRHVTVEPSRGGTLSDHYDPRAKALRLSPNVYQGRSLAALGIAAHEAGHAIQDGTGYAPLRLRNGIVPLASVGSNLGFGLFFIGMLFGAAGTVLGSALIWAGIGLFSLTLIFQLVNLPVEFNASARARRILAETGMVAPSEAGEVRRVLSAAAMTYVAATLTAALTLAYFLLRAGVRR